MQSLQVAEGLQLWRLASAHYEAGASDKKILPVANTGSGEISRLSQRGKVASDGIAEETEVVTPFQQAHNAAGTVFFGDPQHFLRHLGKIFIFEQQAA